MGDPLGDDVMRDGDRNPQMRRDLLELAAAEAAHFKGDAGALGRAAIASLRRRSSSRAAARASGDGAVAGVRRYGGKPAHDPFFAHHAPAVVEARLRTMR